MFHEFQKIMLCTFKSLGFHIILLFINSYYHIKSVILTKALNSQNYTNTYFFKPDIKYRTSIYASFQCLHTSKYNKYLITNIVFVLTL